MSDHKNSLGVADVVGASMTPLLNIGDTVLFDPSRRARSGDVAALHGVVHHVAWRDPWGGVWHCGSYAKRASRVSADEVRGVVCAVLVNSEFVDFSYSPLERLDRVKRVFHGVVYGMRKRLNVLAVR